MTGQIVFDPGFNGHIECLKRKYEEAKKSNTVTGTRRQTEPADFEITTLFNF